MSFGIGMQYALEAADELAVDGIEAEVLDLRTLRPIDYKTLLASVQDEPMRNRGGRFPVGSQ